MGTATKQSARGSKRASAGAGKPKPTIDTAVMSGGAPTSPLMGGFLHALLTPGKGLNPEPKVFRNFHTSGAGALMALLMIAPRKRGNGTRVQHATDALERWVEQGIADEIYKMFPVNFKLFRKPGPFSPMFQRLAERYKVPLQPAASDPFKTPMDPSADLTTRDPVREVLAEWLARPAHDNPSPNDVKRRQGSPTEQLYATLLTLWTQNAGHNYSALMARRDPMKLFRDKWLESVFTSPKQRRVYNDLVDLWFALITPSLLAPRSEGLAQSLPFLEEIVDFDQLKKFKGHFCVNAYNMSRRALEEKRGKTLEQKRADGLANALTKLGRAFKGRADVTFTKDQVDAVISELKKTQTIELSREEKLEANVMEIFEHPLDRQNNELQKDEISGEHIRAAFSMPFIYPPTELNKSYYSEGADHEPIHFHNQHVYANTAGTRIVLLDVLATLEDYLVRRPRDLWDAYVISIMTPVVALARTAILEFEEDQEERKKGGKTVFTLDEIKWNIPSETQPYVMDWSYSNLNQLFRLGQEAGQDFLKRMRTENQVLPNYVELVP